MTDAAVGRLLVASLHQAIADLLPMRLEFYEAWLHPSGLREGRIGLAPLAAVLSFLRLEGTPYHLIAARAGEYTADWTVAGLSPFRKKMILAMPPAIRKRMVVGIAQWMAQSTYGDTNVKVQWRQWRGSVDLKSSLFCEVRGTTARSAAGPAPGTPSSPASPARRRASARSSTTRSAAPSGTGSCG